MFPSEPSHDDYRFADIYAYSNAIKRRKRTTPQQRRELEAQFARDPQPNNVERRDLARRIDMNEKQIQVWFQNRRAKARSKQRRLNASNGSPSSASVSGSAAAHPPVATDSGHLLPPGQPFSHSGTSLNSSSGLPDDEAASGAGPSSSKTRVRFPGDGPLRAPTRMAGALPGGGLAKPLGDHEFSDDIDEVYGDNDDDDDEGLGDYDDDGEWGDNEGPAPREGETPQALPYATSAAATVVEVSPSSNPHHDPRSRHSSLFPLPASSIANPPPSALESRQLTSSSSPSSATLHNRHPSLSPSSHYPHAPHGAGSLYHPLATSSQPLPIYATTTMSLPASSHSHTQTHQSYTNALPQLSSQQQQSPVVQPYDSEAAQTRAGGVLYYGPPTVATGDPAFVAPTAHPHPYLPVEIGGEPAVAVAQTAPLGAGVAETMGMATSQMDQSPQRALTHELSSESMRMRMPMAVEMSSMLPTPGSGGPPPTPLDRPQNGANTHLPLGMPIAVPVSGDHHHPPGGPAFLQAAAAAGEAPSHYPPPHHSHPLVQPQPQAPTPVLPALLSNITLTSPTATRAMIATAPDPSLIPNDASTSSNNMNPTSPVSPTRSRAQRPTIRTALPAGSGDPGRSPQSPNRSPARSYHASAYPYPYLHSPPHWDTPKAIAGTGLAIVSVVSEAGIGASRHVYRRGSVPATVHSARAKQAAAKANAAKAKKNANAGVGAVTATPATGDEPENTGHAPLERGTEVEVEEAHYEGVEMEDSETVMRRPASPRSSNGSTTSSFLEEVAKDKTKKIVPLVSVYDSLKGFNTVQPIHSADDAPGEVVDRGSEHPYANVVVGEASAAPEANGNTVERTDAMISTSSAPSISFLPIASTSTTAAANPAPLARPIATPIFVEEAPLNIQAARRVVLARHYSLPSPSHFPDAAAYSAAPGAEYGIISSALAINGPGGHGHGGRRSPRGRAGGSPTAPSPSPTSPSFAGHRQHPYAGTEKERESAGVGVGYAARRRSLADGSESAGNGSANGNNERRKRRARAAGLMVAIASPTGASAAATSTTATITEEPVTQAQNLPPASLEAANALLPPPVTDSAPYPYDAGAAASSSIPYPSTIGLAAARGAQISPSSFPPSLHYPYQGESVPEPVPYGSAAIGSGFEAATYEAYSYTYHPGAISEVTPGMMASANPALMSVTLPVAVQQPYSPWPVRRVAPSIEFVSTGPLPAADYSFGTAGRRSSSITTAAPNEDVIAGQGALVQEGAGSAEDSGSIHHAGASPGAGSNGATDTTPTQTTPTKDVQASGPSAARRPSSSEYPVIATIDPTQMTEEEFAELDTAVVQPSQDVAVSIIPRHSRLAAPMANGTMPPPAHPPNYHTTPPFIQTPERNKGVLPHPLDSGAALAFGRAAGFQQGPPSASSSRSAFSMPGSGVVPSRFGSFDSGLDSLTSFENAAETESLSLPQAMIVEGGVSGPYDGPQFQDVFEPTKGSDDVVPMHSIQQMMDPRTATTGGTFLPPHPVQSPRAPSSPFTNRLISPVESYALDTRRASCPAPLPPSGGEPSPPNNYVTPAASTTRTDRPPVPSTDWTSIPAANSRQTNAKPATSPIATSSSMPRHFLARMPSAPVIAATNGSSATFDGGPAFDYRPDWERVQPPMLQAYVPPSSEGYTETLVSLGDSPASTSQSGTYAYSPSPITPAWSTDYPSVTTDPGTASTVYSPYAYTSPSGPPPVTNPSVSFFASQSASDTLVPQPEATRQGQGRNRSWSSLAGVLGHAAPGHSN